MLDQFLLVQRKFEIFHDRLGPGLRDIKALTLWRFQILAWKVVGKLPWSRWQKDRSHYNDVIMGAMASQITSASFVYSRRRSKKIPKLRVTGLCEGNSPLTGEFPSQRTSNAKTVSIWWRHHGLAYFLFLRCRLIQGPAVLCYYLNQCWSR